jgi:hypothetical protein
VRVEARVAELCDLLGQKLDSIGGVTEDDGLIDLELISSPVSLYSSPSNGVSLTLENRVLRQWTF